VIVLDTTRAVVEQAKLVAIDDAAIDRWAATLAPDALSPPVHDLPSLLPGNRGQLANLTLLIDALNFCFWSEDPLRVEWAGRTYRRFDAMFVSILRAAQDDPRWFDARHWVEAPSAEIRTLFTGQGRLLMLDQRERVIRETGRTLIDRFDGRFEDAVDSVNRKAWQLAVLLMTNFDSFRDVARYHDQPVYLMKRAQICALDLSIAWEAAGHGMLDGLDELTAFADYRVPQALRQLGILRLDPALAGPIDRQELLEPGSPGEVEIRAATIQAVERMKLALTRSGRAVPTWKLDVHLWTLARGDGVAVEHHRTLTTNY